MVDQSLIDAVSGFGAFDHSNLTYSFYAGGVAVPYQTDYDGSPDGTLETAAWNSYQQGQVSLALQTFSNVADVTFTQAASTDPSDIRFAAADLGDGLLGFAQPPAYANAKPGGLVATNAALSSNWASQAGGPLDQGGYGFITLIHELGHAMGLTHVWENGTDTGDYFPGAIQAGDLGENNLNQGINTMMSYNDGWITSPNGTVTPASVTDYGYEGTPMAFDVYALQQKYGANMSFHAGSDTYVLPGANGPGTFYSCIWDAGGTNSISYSGSGNAVINLNAASLDESPTGGGAVSYVQGVDGGYTIAHGVMIQDAFGGSGNDVLTANDGDDLLDPGAGNNTVYGGAGSDVIVADQGSNLVYEGTGSSSTYLGSGNTAFGQGLGTIVVSGTHNTVVTGAGSSTVYLNGTGNLVSGGAGDMTVVSDNADSASADGVLTANTIQEGAGNDSIFLDDGVNVVVGGTGSSSVTAGAGTTEVFGGSSGTGAQVVYGGSGALTYVAGSLQDSVHGGSGSETVYAGAAGGNFSGGSEGDNMLICGSGAATLVGGGNGDVLYAFQGNQRGGGADLFAGSGNETLVGGADSGEIDFWGGPAGSDAVMFGGGEDNIFHVGQGVTFVQAGEGAHNDFVFTNGAGGGSVEIAGFNTSVGDRIYLSGYGGDARSLATASATTGGGNTVLTLSDNTRITLIGVTDLGNTPISTIA